MGFGAKLASLFKPSGDTISKTMDSTGNLAINLRTAIKGYELDPNVQADLMAKTLEIEAKLRETQANLISGEIGGQSWLQRNWRPLAMLWFLILLSLVWFGVNPAGMSEEVTISLMDLLKMGLGGYIVTQGAEVVADKWNKT